MVNKNTTNRLPKVGITLKRRYYVLYGNIFRSRDWERFGCEYFESKGYEVVALDCLDVARPNHRAELTGIENVSDPRVYRVNPNELLVLLKGIKPHDLVMSVLTIGPSTSWIYQKFAEFNIGYAVITLAPTPLRYHYKYRLGIRRLLRYAYTDARYMFSDIRLRLREWFDPSVNYIYLPAPKWWLRAGAGYFNDLQPKLKKAKVLLTTSNDVAEVARHPISKEDIKNLGIKKPYAVYLDALLSGHPDRQIYNWPIGVTVNKYFTAMNTFFSRVEQELGLEVVIAVHPRSNYLPDSPFGGRRVFLNKTHALVAGAELAISDKSASLSFPVLYRRPVIFVITDELEADLAHCQDINRFSSWMGQVPINVDHLDNYSLTVPNVEESIYYNYERSFLNATQTIPKHEFEPLFQAHDNMIIGQYPPKK